jgi:hypothetical protein
MINNKNEKSLKLSFESDGKMGEKANQKQKGGRPKEFFNITQDSE